MDEYAQFMYAMLWQDREKSYPVQYLNKRGLGEKHQAPSPDLSYQA